MLRHAIWIPVLLLVTAQSVADEIVLKKGKVRGALVKTEGGEAFINPYNSRNPRMTYGVLTVPAAKVKSVREDPSPAARYLRELNRLAPAGRTTDAAAEFKLATLAEELKLKPEAREHLLRTLLRDPGHAEARKRFDEYELKRLFAADPRFNAELAAALTRWRGIESLAERRKQLQALSKQTGFKPSLVYMERVRRSATQPKGRRNDVALTLNSKTDKGVYTIFVPKGYDPMRPWPLVVGLHGGGRDGKDGKDVVGTGRGAMNFYAGGGAKYGYIVVCPSAVRAPWANRMNDTLVRSVLDEVCILFNVDLNRVYLTGHSMGGYGAWHFGPRYAHLWAAIAPMAGGGHNNLAKLRKTMTPVYIYHGENDNVVGCSDSRRAAESLKKAEDDFVYTEIPDSGHGFPPDVAEEMWSFFHRRRLAVAPGRKAKGRFKPALSPCSSFDAPVSKAERLYFGAPGEEAASDAAALVAQMKLGGGAAEEAADALVKLGDKSVVKKLASLAVSKKQSDDVRGAAIRVLGALGVPEAAKPLQKALKGVSLDLLPVTANALAQIRDPKVAKASATALVRAMARVQKEFEGRLFAGKSMAFSDWKRCHLAIAGVARAIGALGDAGGFKALDSVTAKVLLGDWQPQRSRRAGLNPDLPLRVAVIAVIEAFGALGNPRGQKLVAALVGKHGKLRGVNEAAQTARGKLGG